MVSRISTILFILFMLPDSSSAQQVKEWLDENWQVVSNEQQAVYYRLVTQGADGVRNGLVRSYYAEGKPRMVGNFKENNFFGPFTYYYPNGQVESKGNYSDGQRIGLWEEWYSDGTPKEIGTYLPREKSARYRFQDTYRITSFWDSTGTQLVKEGTGRRFSTYANGMLQAEGAYVSGAKEGKWLDYDEQTGNLKHEEIYQAGELLQGTYYSEQGEKSTYTAESFESMPEFPGGMPGLATFLSSNLKYPKEARKQGIKGTVLVGFVINSTGQVKDVQVLKGIGGGCDEEAARVISVLPPWNPGRQRGQPVSVRYSLPIRFVSM